MIYDTYLVKAYEQNNPALILKALIEMKDLVLRKINSVEIFSAEATRILVGGDYDQMTSPLRFIEAGEEGKRYAYIGINFPMAYDDMELSELMYRRTADFLRKGSKKMRVTAPGKSVHLLSNFNNSGFCADDDRKDIFIEVVL